MPFRSFDLAFEPVLQSTVLLFPDQQAIALRAQLSVTFMVLDLSYFQILAHLYPKQRIGGELLYPVVGRLLSID